MQFTKLRLAGFKSFVDPTELVIEPGMTGIVGPNGCGKSNLVEALRWVMGETSAKKMRGAEMDDVIFGGTSLRPARNWAEVALQVDNAKRTAPAEFNNFDDLEVTRRIERGDGSDYRVNGKLTRARDVQLLFADNAIGANSPALVSQGRVGALINARPQERRQLLEEAAGIAGLHSRRHEAELRLRAAEGNLTRLDDVLTALDGQLQSLRKQAKQASRYRNLGEHIRRAEAIVLLHRWNTAVSAEASARATFAAVEEQVGQRMLAVKAANAARTKTTEALPTLRQAEATAAATHQRLVLAAEALNAEERRIAETRAAHERRLAQIATDLERERTLARDAADALARLAVEDEMLAAAQEDEIEQQDAASNAVEDARTGVETLDRELSALTTRIAETEAQRTAAQRRIIDLESRLSTSVRRLDEQRRLLADLDAGDRADAGLATAQQLLEEAEATLEEAQATAESAELAKQEAEAEASQTRETQQAAETERARRKAEVDALTKVLASGGSDLFPPLVDALRVAPGYEIAVAAAFGETLTAPLDSAAPVHWRIIASSDLTPLQQAEHVPISQYVSGPPEIQRALAFVLIAPDAKTAEAISSKLEPGQIVVTREGACWRWDGYTVKAGAPTAAAIRLEQRNRLAEASKQLAEAERTANTARDAAEQTRQIVQNATARDQQARQAVNEVFNRVGQARNSVARATQAAAALASRRQALLDGLERLEEDHAETATALEEARATLAELPDGTEDRIRATEFRAELAEQRLSLAERHSTLDRLVREAADRRRRHQALAQERASWESRSTGADDRVQELRERAEAIREEIAELAERPSALDAERQDLLVQIEGAERAKTGATAALNEAERAASEAETAEKAVEAALAEAREDRVRAEAAVTAAMEARRHVAERVLERLECSPDAIAAATGLADDDTLPPLAETESKLERLLRERESMGPVNLRAEVEVTELEQQIGTLQTEREDLLSAISKLRQGIAGLNREARERLTAAFETVDRHFQDLFGRLFGGGRAHLTLTDPDDPLESGIEIFASPPGKKLQVLSLLSGGEQALTAVALLFAVFLTNPSPICVLDEVDAPLDEANTDRFCTLVEQIARAGATRFLIITHHRLTMARMDRLFGVTMSERGVSQLVSVDLNAAEALRATA